VTGPLGVEAVLAGAECDRPRRARRCVPFAPEIGVVLGRLSTPRPSTGSNQHDGYGTGREQNAFLKTHSWEEYSAWHLGLMGLIACHYRAAEWRHKEIELAAHELLQYLDRKTAR
jgi:hypothetical protein